MRAAGVCVGDVDGDGTGEGLYRTRVWLVSNSWEEESEEEK